MAENKTQPTEADVGAFLDAVKPARRQEDARVLLDMMRKITGLDPVLWGETLIGFGQYHYRYASGREGDDTIHGGNDNDVIYGGNGRDDKGWNC